MNFWTYFWISILIIIPVAFLVVFIYFLLFYICELDLCWCLTKFSSSKYKKRSTGTSSIQVILKNSHKPGILTSEKIQRSWITEIHPHHASNSQINCNNFSTTFRPESSIIQHQIKSNHNNNNNSTSNSFRSVLGDDQFNSCSNFMSFINATKSSASIIPGSMSNVSSGSLTSLHNTYASSIVYPPLTVSSLSVNRYIMCSSEKDAKSRARRAGGGNEPIFHPPNKAEGTIHPHFHPNLPNANKCCVNYFYQFRKNSKSNK